jgi:hypothetical protein
MSFPPTTPASSSTSDRSSASRESQGSYALIPTRGTATDGGIVVKSWSDPIIAATERWLAGKADFRSEADAGAWRPYGEAAVRCMLEGVPVGHCDAGCADVGICDARSPWARSTGDERRKT